MSLFEALALALLAAAIAGLLVYARKQLGTTDEDAVVTAINQCLPQTQCAQCGHPGCLPYAQAIAAGEPINRCPPGGTETISALAELLGREAEPLDPEFGEIKPKRIAVIREPECIGCTLCIQACPVDAIIGAQQYMHSVIPDVCTGCDLCLPPCPVDCIDMIEIVPADTAVREPRKLIDQTPSACIRCGDCEPVCPKGLSPQNLLWQSTSETAMDLLRLDDCIECQLCDRACPSAIPLTAKFIEAKVAMAELKAARNEAELAQQRFEQREQRLASAVNIVKTKPSSSDRAALLARLKK